MIALHKFKTLLDLNTFFLDEKVGREYLAQIRWQGEVKCAYPECGHDHVFTCKSRYKCAKCHRKFSVTVGTIFEDSKVPLRKWFAAIYLITSHKKGISSIQLHKDIGVSQKTAWYMLHRVRNTLGLNIGKEKLTGTVEADETFMGGAEGNKHKNKRTENTQGRSVKTKTPVVGVLQRGGELRAKKVEDTRGYNLRPVLIGNIQFGSVLNTDEWYGYRGLKGIFRHSVVKHNEGQYVDGTIHTNGLEGFWSLLKRGVNGTYHSISDKHLQNYVDEFVFRYNTRKCTEDYRFDMMMNNIGRPLSYKALIADKNTGSTYTQSSLNI